MFIIDHFSSYVSFNEKSRAMGVSSKQQATTNVKNTISCFKRLIGRKFDDQQVQDEVKNFPKPYSIVRGGAGETLIEVKTLYYMGLHSTKPVFGFPTKGDSNQFPHLQRLARKLEFSSLDMILSNK